MNTDERVKCLKQIDLFEFFPEEDLFGLAAKVSEVNLSPGENLFNEGEPGKEMYIILEGSLKVFKESRSITVINPGDYIGEMAIIEDKPRSATVQAIDRCLLLDLKSDQFQEYLARQPKSLVSMMKTLSQRIRKDTELIAEEFEKANILIHDMKNLLSVFLFLDRLEKKLPDDKQLHRYLKFMKDARSNLAEMMKVALANAKRLHHPVFMESGSLSALLTEVVESELSIHPDIKGLRIDFEIDENMPDLKFNSLGIRRVLSNLILNAAQASAPGDTIKVSLSREDGAAVVRVVDSGTGIPDSVKNKIFQLHFTTKPNGNGLGLPSCKEIIEKGHNGSISFQSEPEKGTIFTFRLPFDERLLKTDSQEAKN